MTRTASRKENPATHPQEPELGGGAFGQYAETVGLRRKFPNPARRFFERRVLHPTLMFTKGWFTVSTEPCDSRPSASSFTNGVHSVRARTRVPPTRPSDCTYICRADHKEHALLTSFLQLSNFSAACCFLLRGWYLTQQLQEAEEATQVKGTFNVHLLQLIKQLLYLAHPESDAPNPFPKASAANAAAQTIHDRLLELKKDFTLNSTNYKALAKAWEVLIPYTDSLTLSSPNEEEHKLALAQFFAKNAKACSAHGEALEATEHAASRHSLKRC